MICEDPEGQQAGSTAPHIRTTGHRGAWCYVSPRKRRALHSFNSGRTPWILDLWPPREGRPSTVFLKHIFIYLFGHAGSWSWHVDLGLRCSMWTLSYGTWDLVPSLGVKPRPLPVLATGLQGSARRPCFSIIKTAWCTFVFSLHVAESKLST